MRTRFLFPLLLLLLASSLPAWAQRPVTVKAAAPPNQPPVVVSPAPAPLPGSYRFRIDSLLTALDVNHKLMGSLVLSQNGQVVYSRAVGLEQPGVPARRSTSLCAWPRELNET